MPGPATCPLSDLVGSFEGMLGRAPQSPLREGPAKTAPPPSSKHHSESWLDRSPAGEQETDTHDYSDDEGQDCTGDCPEHPTPPVPMHQVSPQNRLLHAIAFEELAIAALINAEAEKAQAVAKQPVTLLTPDELIAFQHSVAKVLEMAVEKEKLLLKKLRLILFQIETPDFEECE